MSQVECPEGHGPMDEFRGSYRCHRCDAINDVERILADDYRWSPEGTGTVIRLARLAAIALEDDGETLDVEVGT